MNKEQPKKLHFLRTIKHVAPIMFRVAPGLVLWDCFTSVLHGVGWAILVLFRQWLFDDAAALAAGGPLDAALISLGLLILMQLIVQVLNGVCNYQGDIHGRLVSGRMTQKLHEKMSRIDPVRFEDTESLDMMKKAEQGKDNAFWFLMIFLLLFLFYLPNLLVTAAYLFALKPLLALIIPIVFLPTAGAQLVRARVFAKQEDEAAPVRRQYEYAARAMTGRELFRETRMLGGYRYFKDWYARAIRSFSDIRIKAARKSALFETAASLCTAAGYALILYLLLDAVIHEEISVGALAAVLSSVGMVYSLMDEVINRHIGSLTKELGSVSNFIEFMNLPERPEPDAQPPQGDITFEDVHFRYPNAERDALCGVNLTLHRGETLAVVGENGSGKTTLMRVLTGLYSPTGGRLLAGGRPLDGGGVAALRGQMSAEFERFGRYQMTLRDNLAISTGTLSVPDETLSAACEGAGLDIHDPAFVKGLDTFLGREMNEEDEPGAELSGGLWQRVAIARALCREHDIIILDEPTAAIDPMEEKRVYERFSTLARDKTAVIVTHRLGSVRLADRVAVMKEGKVCELGTHAELSARDGEYARMLKAQSAWYQETVSI